MKLKFLTILFLTTNILSFSFPHFFNQSDPKKKLNLKIEKTEKKINHLQKRLEIYKKRLNKKKEGNLVDKKKGNLFNSDKMTLISRNSKNDKFFRMNKNGIKKEKLFDIKKNLNFKRRKMLFRNRKTFENEKMKRKKFKIEKTNFGKNSEILRNFDGFRFRGNGDRKIFFRNSEGFKKNFNLKNNGILRNRLNTSFMVRRRNFRNRRKKENIRTFKNRNQEKKRVFILNNIKGRNFENRWKNQNLKKNTRNFMILKNSKFKNKKKNNISLLRKLILKNLGLNYRHFQKNNKQLNLNSNTRKRKMDVFERIREFDTKKRLEKVGRNKNFGNWTIMRKKNRIKNVENFKRNHFLKRNKRIQILLNPKNNLEKNLRKQILLNPKNNSEKNLRKQNLKKIIKNNYQNHFSRRRRIRRFDLKNRRNFEKQLILKKLNEMQIPFFYKKIKFNKKSEIPRKIRKLRFYNKTIENQKKIRFLKRNNFAKKMRIYYKIHLLNKRKKRYNKINFQKSNRKFNRLDRFKRRKIKKEITILLIEKDFKKRIRKFDFHLWRKLRRFKRLKNFLRKKKFERFQKIQNLRNKRRKKQNIFLNININ